jgi:hypothetical protein
MALHPFHSVFRSACLAATLAAAFCAPGQAAAPASHAPVTEPQPLNDEPVVQHILIEDDGTRIEELHVRGEARRIKVQPKGLSSRFSYEVLPASGARDLSPGPGSTRGAAGQRVWSVLSF